MKEMDLRYRTSLPVVLGCLALVIVGICVVAIYYKIQHQQFAKWDWKLVDVQKKQDGKCLLTLETDLKYSGQLKYYQVGTVWVTLNDGQLIIAESQTLLNADQKKARCEIQGDYSQQEISNIYFETKVEGNGPSMLSLNKNQTFAKTTRIKEQLVAWSK